MKCPLVIVSGCMLAALVSACSIAVPETKVYTLSASDRAPKTIESFPYSIGVGPIFFPDKLKRPQIVTRLSENRLTLSEYHHWAGDIEQEFLTTLVRDIAARLTKPSVETYPWKHRTVPEIQVSLDVFQFDGELGGISKLSVQWSLSSTTTKELLFRKTSVLTRKADNESYDALVASQSALIAELGELIIKQVLALRLDIK